MCSGLLFYANYYKIRGGLNKGALKETKDDIELIITQNDLLLFANCGHGHAPDRRDSNAYIESDYGTWLGSGDYFFTDVSTNGLVHLPYARMIIIWDTCTSGLAINSLHGDGRIVISSCDTMEG